MVINNMHFFCRYLPYSSSHPNMSVGERGQLGRGVSWDRAFSDNWATCRVRQQAKTEKSSENTIVHMFELSNH